jgi:glucokinase
MSEVLVLAADIGGTKTNLAICRGTPTALDLVAEANYLSYHLRQAVGMFIRRTQIKFRGP